MQRLLRFSSARVYTVQVMRWKERKIKSGRMSQISSRLPVGGRSLARPAALSAPAGEDVSQIWSLRTVSSRRFAEAASHEQHRVARAPARLRGGLSHPGAMTAWNRSCRPEGPGEPRDSFLMMHWYSRILSWSGCSVYKCIRMLHSQHNTLHDQKTNIRIVFSIIFNQEMTAEMITQLFLGDLPLRLTCCSGCRRLRSGLTWTWRRPDTRHRPAAPWPGERSTAGVCTPRWPASPSGTHSN